MFAEKTMEASAIGYLLLSENKNCLTLTRTAKRSWHTRERLKERPQHRIVTVKEHRNLLVTQRILVRVRARAALARTSDRTLVHHHTAIVSSTGRAQ